MKQEASSKAHAIPAWVSLGKFSRTVTSNSIDLPSSMRVVPSGRRILITGSTGKELLGDNLKNNWSPERPSKV